MVRVIEEIRIVKSDDSFMVNTKTNERVFQIVFEEQIEGLVVYPRFSKFEKFSKFDKLTEDGWIVGAFVTFEK